MIKKKLLKPSPKVFYIRNSDLSETRWYETDIKVLKLSEVDKKIDDLKIDDDFHEYYKEEILPKDDHLVRILDEVKKRLL